MEYSELEKTVAKQMLLDSEEAIGKYTELRESTDKAAEEFVKTANILMEAFPDPSVLGGDKELGEIAERIFPKVVGLFLDLAGGSL